MRIKRFTAPDMRTALRLVRDEQGPDAVILSSRQAEGGVEVVAATDYDEALVQQSLRTMNVPTISAPPAPLPTPAKKPAQPSRAIFKIDGVPVPSLVATEAKRMPAPDQQPSRLEQMLAVLTPERPTRNMPAPEATLPEPPPAPASTPRIDVRIDDAIEPMQGDDFAAALRRAAEEPQDTTAAVVAAAPPPTAHEQIAVAVTAPERAEPAAPLRAVEADPAVTALHTELAAMRKMIERELGQMATERLRGSPARAAALDALAAFGCDDTIAQRIVQQLDPTLPADTVLPPLRAELAALLPTTGEKILDRGGVIALLGPTGAGKTTTIAKLAARYASRHGARDVALISADNERAGAREQLHVLGRRLGVTVCDADGPEALTHTLELLEDYPLVLIDTAGYGLRDRALLRQILWMRAASNVRSLLVLPANAHPADLGELLRRYRPSAPEGVILTKLDESTRPGAALSLLVQHNLPLAYTTSGQRVPDDIELADARTLAQALELPRRDSAPTPLHDEGHHAFA